MLNYLPKIKIIPFRKEKCNTIIPTFALSEPMVLFILKVKGIAKIPDYVQLRDENFTLLAYFRVDRPEKSLLKIGLSDKEDQINKIISELPFGKIQRLEI